MLADRRGIRHELVAQQLQRREGGGARHGISAERADYILSAVGIHDLVTAIAFKQVVTAAMIVREGPGARLNDVQQLIQHRRARTR